MKKSAYNELNRFFKENPSYCDFSARNNRERRRIKNFAQYLGGKKFRARFKKALYARHMNQEAMSSGLYLDHVVENIYSLLETGKWAHDHLWGLAAMRTLL
jgi:hypothetical protein